jgi:hypothetical protein
MLETARTSRDAGSLQECSSIGRAPVSKTGGRRFEPCHSCQIQISPGKPTTNCNAGPAIPNLFRARHPASIGIRRRPCDDGFWPPQRQFRSLCSARSARPTPSPWIASRRRQFRPTSNRRSSSSGDGTTAGMTMAGADPATTGAGTPSAAVSAGAAAPAGTVGMAADVRAQVGQVLVGRVSVVLVSVDPAWVVPERGARMWAGRVRAGRVEDDREVDVPVVAVTAATDSAGVQVGLNRRRHPVVAAAARAAPAADYWSVAAGPWPAAAASAAAERTPHSRVGLTAVRRHADRPRRDRGPENRRCKAETRPACRLRVVARCPGPERTPGSEAEERSGTGTRMRPPHPIGRFDATPFRNPAPLLLGDDEVINMRQ